MIMVTLLSKNGCDVLVATYNIISILVRLASRTPEWILGFCQDGPTPPSHSQKGANVESSRTPYPPCPTLTTVKRPQHRLLRCFRYKI